MTVTLYGIPNCDTVKKARKWLEAQGIAHDFHDYKKQGVPARRLSQWISDKGWEVLLNRRGTTFHKLDEAEKSDIDAARAEALMIAHPSMIKRPVAEHAGGILVGFNEADWAAALQ